MAVITASFKLGSRISIYLLDRLSISWHLLLMSTTLEIESLLSWREPNRVRTGQGERNLRKAMPTESFWEQWRSNKTVLKAAGISLSKDNRTGQWEACWWQAIDEAERKAKASAEADSRATDNAAIELPVPEGLAYLPYQRAGIAYALERQGVLFGDEMGLGKTVQAIGTINADESIQKVLVICPAGLKLNWYRELKRWLTRSLSIQVVNGKGWIDADILVVAYTMLEKHHTTIHSTSWDLVIADEIHNIKNPDAQRTQEIAGRPARAAKGKYAATLPKPSLNARRKLGLSGTPMVNRPIELYSTISWLRPDLWPANKRFSYAMRYCNAHQNSYGWDFSGSSHLDELQHSLRQNCMVRRLKKDVLTELPPKRRQVIELSVEGDMRKLLDREIQMHDDSGLMNSRLRSTSSKRVTTNPLTKRHSPN